MKRTVPRIGKDPAALAVAQGEFIGVPVRVAGSTDPGMVGLAGTVIDETLHTLVVRRADGREIRVGKAESVFEFTGGAGPVRIAGAAIEFRPHERTKKVR